MATRNLPGNGQGPVQGADAPGVLYTPPVWQFPGNEFFPDTPIPGRRGPGGGAIAWPVTKINPANTQRIIDPTRFQQFQSQYQALAQNQTFLILSEPPGVRLYLEIKVSATSIGTLAIGINNAPNDLQHANWIVTPGGPSLVFPAGVIPQNRLYGLAVGGMLDYVVTYANLEQ